MVQLIIAISGKRKSGKDYCSKIFLTKIRSHIVSCEIVGISYSLKEEYAKMHGLNFQELLSDGPYKEIYRKKMIVWGETQRTRDPGIFCRAAIESSSNPDVLIISDCRRSSDMEYFKNSYKTLAIRVETPVKVREDRGFEFVEGVDDAESECGLDDYEFDEILENDDKRNVELRIDEILKNRVFSFFIGKK